MKIVFLNGPRHSGKDQLGTYLEDCGRVRLLKFVTPVEKIFRDLFPMKDERYRYLREEGKLEKCEELMGMSLVDWFIKIPEEWIKPNLGQDWLGQLALRQVRLMEDTHSPPTLVVFTDSGFPDEARPLVERYGVAVCRYIRIKRPGKTFEGDSRNYWELPGLPVEVLNNNGSLTQWKKKAQELYQSLLTTK